jgi:hypothetical protein
VDDAIAIMRLARPSLIVRPEARKAILSAKEQLATKKISATFLDFAARNNDTENNGNSMEPAGLIARD